MEKRLGENALATGLSGYLILYKRESFLVFFSGRPQEHHVNPSFLTGSLNNGRHRSSTTSRN